MQKKYTQHLSLTTQRRQSNSKEKQNEFEFTYILIYICTFLYLYFLADGDLIYLFPSLMQPQDVADLVSNEVNHTIWTFLQISSYRLQLFCPYCLMDFHVHIIQNGEILAKPLQTPAHKITQWPQTHFLPLAFVLFITHSPPTSLQCL